MSGRSVRDLDEDDANQWLEVTVPGYDEAPELDWSVIHDGRHGWVLQVQDDGGDVRLWTIRLGEIGEEFDYYLQNDSTLEAYHESVRHLV